MDQLTIAVLVSAGLSILICTIEVKFQSKKVTFRNCITGSFLVYTVIVVIGNTATTLVVAATLGSGVAGTSSGAPGTPSPGGTKLPTALLEKLPWFWYAFLGVFGFEVLLQNINVSFLNRGLLSISDWINKARESAVAAAIEAEANSTNRKAQTLSNRLKMLAVADLDAHVINLLGAARLTELNTVSTTTGANGVLVKALALAQEAPDRAQAIA